MKRFIIVLIAVLCLVGCTNTSEEDSSLKLDEEQLMNYNNKISEELKKFQWSYDESSNTFEKGVVESEKSDDYNAIAAACESVGYDIKGFGGKDIILATTNLLHFNNETAGKAYFYFNGEELIGEYYKFNNNIYSMNDKGVFLSDISFENLENTQIKRDFESIDINNVFENFCDIDSDGNVAVIDDDYKLTIYKLGKNKSFKSVKSVSFSDEGFYPMDICFSSVGAVVLLGKNETVQTASQSIEYEDSHDSSENNISLKSWRVEFLDKNFNKRNAAAFDLDLSNYTSVNVLDGRIFLLRGNSVDIFSEKDGKWVKSTQIMLNNNIENIKFTDIDGDGISEAVATDGMDIYVYEYKDTFELIWRTNLSINSMKNDIYIEDLNGDGIKEIYIEDLSGTSAKIILDKKGFKNAGEGIGYQHKIAAGDFNSDGKADYIEKITINDGENEETNTVLYLAK